MQLIDRSHGRGVHDGRAGSAGRTGLGSQQFQQPRFLFFATDRAHDGEAQRLAIDTPLDDGGIFDSQRAQDVVDAIRWCGGGECEHGRRAELL